MTGEFPEHRIRELLAQGLEKTEIARRLGISRKTLYKYLNRMREAGTLPDGAGIQSVSKGRNQKGQFAHGNGGGPGAPKGNTNRLVHGERSAIWWDAMTPAEQAAFEASCQATAKQQAHEQVALCDWVLGRLARRLQALESLPGDLVVDGETALRKLTGERDDDTRVATMLPSAVITRSVTVREAILAVQKAIRELLKERARAVKLRADLEVRKNPRPNAGAGDQPGDPLGEMSDADILDDIRRLRGALSEDDPGGIPPS